MISPMLAPAVKAPMSFPVSWYPAACGMSTADGNMEATATPRKKTLHHIGTIIHSIDHTDDTAESLLPRKSFAESA